MSSTGSTASIFNNLNLSKSYLAPNENNPVKQNSITRQILEWAQDINPLGYYLNFGTSLSSAIGVLEGSGGGTIYLPAGYTANTTSTFGGVSLLYDGPQVPFKADAVSTSPIWVADRLLRNNQFFASSTSSFIYYAFAIEAQTDGQGADGPQQQNGGLFIATYKTSWAAGNRQNLNKGEIDALQIWVRQAGPSAVEGQGSDSSCILGNLEMQGDSGFSAFAEFTNTNVQDDFSVHNQIDLQMGVIDRSSSGRDVAYGYVATMTTGIGTNGILVQNSGGGQWTVGYALSGPNTYTRGLDFSAASFSSFPIYTGTFIVDGGGNVQATSVAIPPVAVLPSAQAGTIIFLNDASSSAASLTTVTSGTFTRPAYWDGTTWRFV